jgi:hypothetical protein
MNKYRIYSAIKKLIEENGLVMDSKKYEDFIKELVIILGL